jgi:hypothetical protein
MEWGRSEQMEKLIEPICSECGMAPWEHHCCTCEPCVVKRIDRKLSAPLEDVNRLDQLDGWLNSGSTIRKYNEVEVIIEGVYGEDFCAPTLRRAIDRAARDAQGRKARQGRRRGKQDHR